MAVLALLRVPPHLRRGARSHCEASAQGYRSQTPSDGGIERLIAHDVIDVASMLLVLMPEAP
jgi:hypothetical protein